MYIDSSKNTSALEYDIIRVLMNYSVTDLSRLFVNCYISFTMHIFEQKFWQLLPSKVFQLYKVCMYCKLNVKYMII